MLHYYMDLSTGSEQTDAWLQGWIKQWNMVRDIGACSKVFRICLNHDMLEPVNPILVMYVLLY